MILAVATTPLPRALCTSEHAPHGGSVHIGYPSPSYASLQALSGGPNRVQPDSSHVVLWIKVPVGTSIRPVVGAAPLSPEAAWPHTPIDGLTLDHANTTCSHNLCALERGQHGRQVQDFVGAATRVYPRGQVGGLFYRRPVHAHAEECEQRSIMAVRHRAFGFRTNR